MLDDVDIARGAETVSSCEIFEETGPPFTEEEDCEDEDKEVRLEESETRLFADERLCAGETAGEW